MTRGFWMKTRRGVVAHVQGDPEMSAESADALEERIDAAFERLASHLHEHQDLPRSRDIGAVLDD